MKVKVFFASLAVVLSGCTAEPVLQGAQGENREAGISLEIVRPKARPKEMRRAAPPPPVGARTAEQFDTTSAADRAAATQIPDTGGTERALGTTIASLGTPSETGFWLKTPMVTREQPGRVVYPATGKSVQVTLIPIDGPATAGSRMSLAALRLIEAPLAGLPEVEVYAGG